MKEPLFFASDLRPYLHSNPDDPRRRPLFPATYEEYLSLFEAAGPARRAGEASSSYLRSRVAATAIAKVQPAARIIAILREPASFLRSLHLQRLQEGVESEADLARALELEGDRRQGRNLPARVEQAQMLMYTDFVDYAEQLRRYQREFSAEQMLVLIYDDFRTDNRGTLREVFRFLEVDEAAAVEPSKANPTVTVRSKRLQRLTRRAQAGRGMFWGPVNFTVKTLTSPAVRRNVLDPLRNHMIYRQPPPPDEDLVRQLRERYKPLVVELSQQLERDLVSLWGYERLS